MLFGNILIVISLSLSQLHHDQTNEAETFQTKKPLRCGMKVNRTFVYHTCLIRRTKSMHMYLEVNPLCKSNLHQRCESSMNLFKQNTISE